MNVNYNGMKIGYLSEQEFLENKNYFTEEQSFLEAYIDFYYANDYLE